MGRRPGGMSRITDTSRSPYTVSASVRGIGVAVLTSTSGWTPFPRTHVARQQTIHRLRPLQIVHDFLQPLLLPRRQAERENAPRRIANAIVNLNLDRLALGRRRAASRQHAHLEQKRFFEDQPALRRHLEAVQRLERRVSRWKMRSEQRRAPPRQRVP